jgi:DNA polymerase-3 subunit delta'
MQFKPAEAQYKVLIVWMVEKMHDYAANALLKLIEEPPDNTLIFMIANEKEKLLSTILSRVQTLVVPPIEKEDLYAFLRKQNSDLNRIELDDVINLSGGDIFKAKEIISDSDELQTNFNLFVDWMRLCYKTGSLEGIKNWVDNINKFGREKQKSFLYYSLRMVRESLLSNYGNEELVKLMHNEAEFLKKFAPFIHLKNAPEIQKNIELSVYEIERNAASAPLFSNLSLQMSILLKKPR